MTLPQRGSLQALDHLPEVLRPRRCRSAARRGTPSRGPSAWAPTRERRSTASRLGASSGSFDRSLTNSVTAPVAVISRLSERRIAGSFETMRILWRSIASAPRRRSSPLRRDGFARPWLWGGHRLRRSLRSSPARWRRSAASAPSLPPLLAPSPPARAAPSRCVVSAWSVSRRAISSLRVCDLLLEVGDLALEVG